MFTQNVYCGSNHFLVFREIVKADWIIGSCIVLGVLEAPVDC